MKKLATAALRRWIQVLLHVNDTPRRTALAFGIGVFLGFSPFLGFHTILGILIAFTFNLNRVAVLLGVYANTPWTLPAWYSLATEVGARLLGMKVPPLLSQQWRRLFDEPLWHQTFWIHLAHMMRPFLWPFLLGPTVLAAVLAATSYAVALRFIVAHRARYARTHPSERLSYEDARER